MGNKDIAEKFLENYNDVFSDIVNNLVFDGACVVDERDLEQAGTRSSYRSEKKFREQERDSSKYWKKNNIRIAFFGFENETDAEDDMPFRVIGYDGAAYRDQIRFETGRDGRRHKVMTRYPVITLVLYFGYKKHWNKARSLYDVFGRELDRDMATLVNDYKINLYEIAYLSDEQVSRFKSDFRFVADYFVQMRKYGEYKGSHDEMHHAREVLQLLGFLTNDDRFVMDLSEGKEIRTMCEALDIIEKRGIVRVLSDLVRDGILSISEAAKRAGMSVEEFRKVTAARLSDK